MVEHAERGIQLESVWASPLLVAHAITGGAGLEVVSQFGGQDLAGPWVWPAYVQLARWAGFLALAGFLGVMGWLLLRTREATARLTEIQLNAYLLDFLLAVLLGTLSPQRVRSPQFFSWILYPATIRIVAGRRWLEGGLVVAVFALTLVNFRWGWDHLLTPGSIYPLLHALKSLCLWALTALVCVDLFSRHLTWMR